MAGTIQKTRFTQCGQNRVKQSGPQQGLLEKQPAVNAFTPLVSPWFQSQWAIFHVILWFLTAYAISWFVHRDQLIHRHRYAAAGAFLLLTVGEAWGVPFVTGTPWPGATQVLLTAAYGVLAATVIMVAQAFENLVVLGARAAGSTDGEAT